MFDLRIVKCSRAMHLNILHIYRQERTHCTSNREFISVIDIIYRGVQAALSVVAVLWTLPGLTNIYANSTSSDRPLLCSIDILDYLPK